MQDMDGVSSKVKKKFSISFIFVPGHAVVQDNERAGNLAGLATISGQPLDHAYIIN